MFHISPQSFWFCKFKIEGLAPLAAFRVRQDVASALECLTLLPHSELLLGVERMGSPCDVWRVADCFA